MKINKHGCSFCNEFNGKKHLSYFENTFGLKYNIDNRNVLETQNFVCVPTIGSFISGYLLIIPRKHYTSSLSMPDNFMNELVVLIEFLKNFYLECYQSNCILFEHGSIGQENPGGMSVVHAHLHILPYKKSIIPSINDFVFDKYASFSDLKDDYLLCFGQAPYLLLKDIDDYIYYCEHTKIPSQYFRKTICNCYGLDGMGDWRQYPFIDNIKKTIEITNKYQLQKKYEKYMGEYYG